MKYALGWYDERVWVNSDHTIRGAIRHRYDSLGCKPGLPTSPQTVVSGGAGSQQFFADGRDVPQQRRDLTLWLHGPIDHEFRAVGRERGVLGLPTSTATSLSRRDQGHLVQRLPQDLVHRRPDLRTARRRGARAVGQRARLRT
jgi:hypothetical protein